MAYLPKNGVKMVKKDHRDYSLHRTFGGVSPSFVECNFDAGLTNRDQVADGLPNGCTGYTNSDIAGDEDRAVYVPKYSYDMTLVMEGITPSNPQFEQVGCDIRKALSSTIVYGLQKQGEGPELALNHRRGAYYNVELVGGLDWFDSIRYALQINQISISLATPWFAKFALPVNGIIQAPPSYDVTFASWHNHKVCGWKSINGVPYLIDKSWQGSGYGDNGFVYFPREVINQIMSINGSGAFTIAPFNSTNLQTVRLTIFETIASYFRMITALLAKSAGSVGRLIRS